MKPYIKPETISVELQSAFSMMEGTGVTQGKTLGKGVVSNGTFYTKEDNAWDDFDE
ncbi:MAG: hypothetical protein IKP44_04430 [Bacteroidaceae bacterium]|nr:hypothetical protein [Bacteroidaceae bacterium]